MHWSTSVSGDGKNEAINKISFSGLVACEESELQEQLKNPSTVYSHNIYNYTKIGYVSLQAGHQKYNSQSSQIPPLQVFKQSLDLHRLFPPTLLPTRLDHLPNLQSPRRTNTLVESAENSNSHSEREIRRFVLF
jgi:hypothetical protein